MLEQAERVEFFEGGDEAEQRASRPAQASYYFDLIAQKHRGRWRGEVNPVRWRVADPAEATRYVREQARRLGAHLVGITEVNPAYVYRGREVGQRFAIVLGMEMDYQAIARAPETEAAVEVARVYYELGETTLRLAEHIRNLGYPATSHHPLGGGAVLLVPLAIAAGLGEQGRNGLAINRRFGPRFRIGCITTDLPLVTDEPVDLAVSSYCERCQVCQRACPEAAIPERREWVRGVLKYTIDASRCRRFFNRTSGCGICIKVCVFNELAHRGIWLKTRTGQARA